MAMNASFPFLSVLAAGVSGNARLYEKLGDSEASRAVDRCLKRIRRSIEALDGRIVRMGGGEVIAAFNTADTVVNAAIEMLQRVADLPPVSGVKMTIRVGISCVGISCIDSASDAGQPVEDILAGEAAHLAGMAKPGQILAVGRIQETLTETARKQVTDTGAILPDESGRKETVVEIIPREALAHPVGSANGSLRLHYRKKTVVLDEYKPVIDIGRDDNSDVIIHDARASRNHAVIERRGNLVVLIDKSTNGTYVSIDGGSERFLRHSECTLYGKGVITFAAPISASGTDCAQFECP